MRLFSRMRLGQVRPGERVGEFRGRRIGSVARAGHVVFLHQIEIDFKHAHLNLSQCSPDASIFSSFALGGTPWPRLKICPGRPFISRRMRRGFRGDEFRAGAQQERIEIALDADIRRQARATFGEAHVPIHAENLRAGIDECRSSCHGCPWQRR